MLDGESAHDVHLHYFLRPDHWDVADLWAPHWGPDLPPLAFHDRHDWLFDHIENLHEAGSRTICAVNGRTGGVAGFVTFDPRRGAPQSDRGGVERARLGRRGQAAE